MSKPTAAQLHIDILSAKIGQVASEAAFYKAQSDLKDYLLAEKDEKIQELEKQLEDKE